MPRNSAGTMSATNGPYVAGTVINVTQVNARFADEENELSDSLSRSGKGGMLAPIKTPDGSAAAPAHTFTSEASGWYRAAAGDLRLAIAGVDLISFKNNTFQLLIAGNPIIQATGANSVISVLGNRTATDTGADLVAGSTATRTAGRLLDVQNGGTNKASFDYQGLLSLTSQAGPIQPANIWTAITPNANWTAGGGLAYWKDATGTVHLKGTATFATGAATGVFTLPAGFRPAAIRTPLGLDASIAATTPVTVNIDATTGLVSIFGVTLVNTHAYSFDGVSFLAEQ